MLVACRALLGALHEKSRLDKPRLGPQSSQVLAEQSASLSGTWVSTSVHWALPPRGCWEQRCHVAWLQCQEKNIDASLGVLTLPISGHKALGKLPGLLDARSPSVKRVVQTLILRWAPGRVRGEGCLKSIL